MKSNYLILFIVLITFSSCSEGFSVLAKILGLDKETEQLEIEFQFKRFTKDQNVQVDNIKIYKDDSLQYELSTESELITHWNFPDVPDGFTIVYPPTLQSLPSFVKSEELKFEFSGQTNKAAYGSWHYKPSYTRQENRWMFDKEGNKKVTIHCDYESWVGKDIIKIIFNKNFHIDEQSFTLEDEQGDALAFELKTKKNPTDKVALVLEDDLQKGMTIQLSFKSKNGELYEDKIVKGDSGIGLIGKLNDL